MVLQDLVKAAVEASECNFGLPPLRGGWAGAPCFIGAYSSFKGTGQWGALTVGEKVFLEDRAIVVPTQRFIITALCAADAGYRCSPTSSRKLEGLAVAQVSARPRVRHIRVNELAHGRRQSFRDNSDPILRSQVRRCRFACCCKRRGVVAVTRPLKSRYNGAI